MARKKKQEIIEEQPLLEHACILCVSRNSCSLPFPLDCDVNDCTNFIKDNV